MFDFLTFYFLHVSLFCFLIMFMRVQELAFKVIDEKYLKMFEVYWSWV